MIYRTLFSRIYEIQQAGFTIIEIAISLVVIGLTIGGLFVGKDIIHSAEIRSQIGQINEYSIGYNDYKIKYNCTIGDCPQAVSIFGAADQAGNSVNNGDGNGRIDTLSGNDYDTGAATMWSTSLEMSGAFQQLGMSNMVSFVPKITTSSARGTSHPVLKINPQAGFFFGADYNFRAPGGRNPDILAYKKGVNAIWMVDCGTGGNAIGGWDNNCGVFTASDLQQIDLKIDDGAPLKGKLIGFGGWNSNNNCLVSGNNAYDFSYTTPQCQAVYVVE